MYHNLVINILENVLLTIVWEGENNHGAYWHLVATHPITGSVVQMVDGPFPNQYMAASDIFKRFSELKGFRVVTTNPNPRSLQEDWKERFGVNFKLAFKAAQSIPEPVEDVYYCNMLQ